MVTSLDTALGSDDLGQRAQLILVGAVAIAIIVMGLVVVFNTVLYTDNVASTGEVNEPKEAEQVTHEINGSTKRLIERVNAGVPPDDSKSDVVDAVHRNLSTYSNGYSNSSALHQQSVINVTEPNDDERKFAARISDTDDLGNDDFTAPGDSGDRDWSVTVGDTGVLVRDFNMMIDMEAGNLESGGEDAFHVVWNATNQEANYTVWLYEDGSGDLVLRTLAIEPGESEDPRDFGAGSASECVLGESHENETVTINITDGIVQGYPGCSADLDVHSSVSKDRFSTVDFFNSDNASGRYSMVAWRDDSDPGSYISSDITDPSSLGLPVDDTETPHWSYAVWEMEVTVSYESSSLSYSNTYVIEVYNRTR
jgi:hypothetical protein